MRAKTFWMSTRTSEGEQPPQRAITQTTKPLWRREQTKLVPDHLHRSTARNWGQQFLHLVRCAQHLLHSATAFLLSGAYRMFDPCMNPCLVRISSNVGFLHLQFLPEEGHEGEITTEFRKNKCHRIESQRSTGQLAAKTLIGASCDGLRSWSTSTLRKRFRHSRARPIFKLLT